MIDFALLSEANKFAKDSADEEIENFCKLYEWSQEEIKLTKDIIESMLSCGYYNGARKYKDSKNE